MAGWGATKWPCLPSVGFFLPHGLLGGGRPHPGLVAAVDRRGEQLGAALSFATGYAAMCLLTQRLLNPHAPRTFVIGGVAGAIRPWWGRPLPVGNRGASRWFGGCFSLVMLWTRPFLGFGPVAVRRITARWAFRCCR